MCGLGFKLKNTPSKTTSLRWGDTRYVRQYLGAMLGRHNKSRSTRKWTINKFEFRHLKFLAPPTFAPVFLELKLHHCLVNLGYMACITG